MRPACENVYQRYGSPLSCRNCHRGTTFHSFGPEPWWMNSAIFPPATALKKSRRFGSNNLPLRTLGKTIFPIMEAHDFTTRLGEG